MCQAALPPTADAYRKFLSHQGLAERIQRRAGSLDVDDVVALARRHPDRISGLSAPFPAELEAEIKTAYEKLTAEGGAAFRRAFLPPPRKICQVPLPSPARSPS